MHRLPAETFAVAESRVVHGRLAVGVALSSFASSAARRPPAALHRRVTELIGVFEDFFEFGLERVFQAHEIGVFHGREEDGVPMALRFERRRRRRIEQHVLLQKVDLVLRLVKFR